MYDTGDGFGDAESAGGNAIAVDMESARFVRHWCGRSTQGDTAHFLEVKVDVILDVRGSTDHGASHGSAAAGSLQLAYPLVSDNSGVAPPAVVADVAGVAYVQPQELRFPYSGPARDVATTLHYRAVDDSGQAAVCAVQVVVDDLEKPRIDCHDDLAVRDGATRPGRLYGTPADGVAIQAADVRDNSGETLTTTPLVRGRALTNTTKFYYAGRDGARRSALVY